jgi:hypothetical protein
MTDNILKIAMGCAGVVSFLHSAPELGAAVSLIVAVLSICDQVINYGSLAAHHADAQRAYLDLLARNQATPATALKAKLAGMDAKFSGLNEIESLRTVAQNDTLRSAGEPVDPENLRERLMRCLA